jgi:cytidine deaminase
MREGPLYSPFIKEAPVFGLTESQVKKYIRLTLIAKEAKAYPSQSGYFVRTSGLAVDGAVYRGGNKEHGFNDAFVHGETAVISGLRDITSSPIEAIAWYEPLRDGKKIGPTDFGRPCGNCLDVMMAYCSPNLVLLNGNETGIVYTRLTDFLFEDFHPTETGILCTGAIEKALAAADQAVDIYLPEGLRQKVYGAALVSDDGTMWSGIQYTNAGYDAVSPIMSAVLHWCNDYPGGTVSERHLNLRKLVVAGRREIPHPLYRDRQVILELDEILRRFRGDSKPLEVELVQVNNNTVMAGRSDVEEWLPHPFTPGAFRMDDVMLAELAKLIGVEEAGRIFKK